MKSKVESGITSESRNILSISCLLLFTILKAFTVENTSKYDLGSFEESQENILVYIVKQT